METSINKEENFDVVSGDGEMTFVDESMMANNLPIAASTVVKPRTRRVIPHSVYASFINDSPEKMQSTELIDQCSNNKAEMSRKDDRSSMGIINIEDMDLSNSNLLLEPINRCGMEKESSYGNIQRNEGSSRENITPSDLSQGSSTMSNNSRDTKSEQLFARSQMNTVKKIAERPQKTVPIPAAIKHSLFGQMTIGEEGDMADASTYEVELQADELDEIDNDFGEINLSCTSENGEECGLDSKYLRPGIHVDQSKASTYLSKVSLFEDASTCENDTEDELEQNRPGSTTIDDSARTLSKYLIPSQTVNYTNPSSMILPDSFVSQNQKGDEDNFSFEKRQISGFDAGDVLQQTPVGGLDSSPFGQFESSFGSFGLEPGSNESGVQIEENQFIGNQSWTQNAWSPGMASDSKQDSMWRISNVMGPEREQNLQQTKMGTEMTSSQFRSSSGRSFDSSGIFKKPFLPAPKAAVFTKSVSKLKPEADRQRPVKSSINNDDFFNNDDALLMLQKDEEQFLEENKFKQGDVKEVVSASCDNWSINCGDITQDQLRISMGTYIRGRSQPLGSIGGEEDIDRPDFGMVVSSPKKGNYRQTEEINAKGSEHPITEPTYQNGNEKSIIGEADQTITDGNYTITNVSAWIKESIDLQTIEARLGGTHETKNAKSDNSKNKLKSLSKTSHLPVRRDSTLQKTNADNKSLIGRKNDEKKSTSRVSKETSTYRKETPDNIRNLSPKPTGRESGLKEVVMSKKSSICVEQNSGLIDVKDEYQFSERSQNTERTNMSYPSQTHPINTKTSLTEPLQLQGSHLREQRQKIPPPDGDEGLANSAQRVSAPKMGLKLDSNIKRSVGAHRTDQRLPELSTSRDSSRSNNSEVLRSDTSSRDHGYMLGHHIPDGTAYSQPSDFSHMDHKGMSREDVAGVDDIGLAESREFDVLNRQNDSQALCRKLLDWNHDDNCSMDLQAGSTSQTGARENRTLRHEIINNDETQTGRDILRIENGMQTSLVRNPGNQPDNVTQLNDNQDFRTNLLANADLGAQTFNNEPFNMTDNTNCQQNFLTQNSSLLRTQFAQENLRRDYGIEVMDRIYSNVTSSNLRRDPVGQNDTVISSQDWTLLRDRQSIYQSQMSDISHLDSFVQSAPMPMSNDTLFSQTGGLTYHQSQIPGPELLCPGVLKFRNVCCVGISQIEKLQLKNPTEGWMECIFEILCLKVDGQQVSMDLLPFEWRRKVIIEPYKTENIDIQFLPKMAGAFVAQIQILSRAVTRSSEPREANIPVGVTFQAIAEQPKIHVHGLNTSSGVLDFGEIAWGSSAEKSITIENLGHATVPVRLAITSTNGWHCFSFEPEGQIPDVSVISGIHVPQSGHGRMIISINLSGCEDQFNRRAVTVWCRPKHQKYNQLRAGQPSELATCNIDIDIDIPCSRFQKLASVPLKACLGFRRLHVQDDRKEMHLRANTPGKLTLFNRGNLDLDLYLRFSKHEDVFTVTPNSVTLRPWACAEIKVDFKPQDRNTTRYNSLLLMEVLKDNKQFEINITGARHVEVICDHTDLDFGGVAIGDTVIKRYRLKNCDPNIVKMTAESRAADICLVPSHSPTAMRQKRLDLVLLPNKEMPVHVAFSPSNQRSLAGIIVMKPENEPTVFVVNVKGYGGVSKLCCLSGTSHQDRPYIKLECREPNTVTEIVLSNIGQQRAIVETSFHTDSNRSEPLTSVPISVVPSEFTIDVQQRKVIKLVASMSMAALTNKCNSSGLLAVLKLKYQDDVNSKRPHRSDLLLDIVLWEPLGPAAATTTSRPSYRSLENFPNASQPLRDITSNRALDNPTLSETYQTGNWSINPQEIVLYCSKGATRCQRSQFTISNNNNNVDLRLEISLSTDLLSIIPYKKTIPPRESTHIGISMTEKASKRTDLLPYSGQIRVQANEQVQYLKVKICWEPTDVTDEPVQDDTKLVPLSSNVPQPYNSVKKIGDLEVSKTRVLFSRTTVGNTSSEVLLLKNVGPDLLRWIFSSFASPYFKKTADRSQEAVRISYKVFDFSHQFGKIKGHETVELKLSFMPRSSGTFTQYWDLQVPGNAGQSIMMSGQDFIQIQLIGEGFEEPEQKKTRETLQFISRETKGVFLVHNITNFSPLEPGTSACEKTEIKNGTHEDIQVEVTPPSPPFYIQHKHFRLKKQRYLKFPVEFKPSRPGKYSDMLQFKIVNGENLTLYLNGECLQNRAVDR